MSRPAPKCTSPAAMAISESSVAAQDQPAAVIQCFEDALDHAIADGHGHRLAAPGGLGEPQVADLRHAAAAIPQAFETDPCIGQSNKHALGMHDKSARGKAGGGIRQALRRGGEIDADADHDGEAVRRALGLEQDPGELAAAGDHVIRPFERDVRRPARIAAWPRRARARRQSRASRRRPARRPWSSGGCRRNCPARRSIRGRGGRARRSATRSRSRAARARRTAHATSASELVEFEAVEGFEPMPRLHSRASRAQRP